MVVKHRFHCRSIVILYSEGIATSGYVLLGHFYFYFRWKLIHFARFPNTVNSIEIICMALYSTFTELTLSVVKCNNTAVNTGKLERIDCAVIHPI